MKLTAAAILSIAAFVAADEDHFTLSPPGSWGTLAPGWGKPKFTTSTVYSTTTKTIVSCHPTVTLCPAHSTAVTTIVIPVSTTICPITYSEAPTPTPYPTATWEAPTGYPTAAPSSSELPPPPPAPESSYEASAPPAPGPTEEATSVGTINIPSATTSGLAAVTAGASQNIQRAGGALAAVALAAALI